jgi:biotin synthase-like enzyme
VKQQCRQLQGAFNRQLAAQPRFSQCRNATSQRLYNCLVCLSHPAGLGEGEQDRVGLIHQLATLPAHPESVPINRLVAIKVGGRERE